MRGPRGGRRAMGAWLAAAMLLAAGCGSGDGPAGEASATPGAGGAGSAGSAGSPAAIEASGPEGRVSLVVPDAALPDGVERSAITVRAVPLDEAQRRFAQPVVASFDFEPDGLAFEAPLDVTVRIPADAVEGGVIVVEEIDGELTPVEEIDAAFDPEADELVLGFAIDHFSRRTLVTFGYISASIEPAFVDVPVGESFTLDAAIERFDTTPQMNEGGGDVTWELAEEAFTARGRFTARRPIAPTVVSDRPPDTAMTDRFSFTQGFTCEGPAFLVRLEYVVRIRFPLSRIERDRLPTFFNRATAVTRDTSYITCREASVATPTPTATPDDGFGEELAGLVDSYFGADVLGQYTTMVAVIRVGGVTYPVFQFREAGADACDAEHWHADEAWPIPVAADTRPAADPNPNACGFGRTSEVPVERIQLTKPEVEAFFRAIGLYR